MTIPLTPVGQTCGECQLCCKLMGVKAFEKPDGEWCPKVGPSGCGCSIYETRPEECVHFTCMWLAATHSPPELRPDKIHGLMISSLDGENLVLYEDPLYPGQASATLKPWLDRWIEDGTRYYVVACGTDRMFFGNMALFEAAVAMMNEALTDRP